MYSQLLIGLLLCSNSLAALIKPTPSTPDATITPAPHVELFRKQNDVRYIGWYTNLVQGNWSTHTCATGTYFQKNNNWGCCGTNPEGCGISRTCVGSTLVYTSDTRVYSKPCTSSYPVCLTALMFERYEDSSARSYVNCFESASVTRLWSYWRQQPEMAKTTSTPSPGSTATSAGPTSTAVNPGNREDENNEGGKSKAWIAGAVVGPVLGLALAALAFWFCIKRKKRTAAPTTTDTSKPLPNGQTPPTQYHSPHMQQSEAAAGVPFGVAQQQWPQQSTQPIYAPSTLDPQQAYGQPTVKAMHLHGNGLEPVSSELEGTAVRPVSSELDGAAVRPVSSELEGDYDRTRPGARQT